MLEQEIKLEYKEEIAEQVLEILLETERRLQELDVKTNIGAPRPRP